MGQQFQINYLGVGSATPSLRHLPSCQVINYHDNLFMVDCGEGAQHSMRVRQLKFSRLTHFFISHLHGDHCLGLPGLISTLALSGKEGGEIVIHTFPDGIAILKEILGFFCRSTPFDIRFSEVSDDGEHLIYETDSIKVSSFPLFHRVPCVGYKFEEKEKPRHIIGDMIRFHQVPVKDIHAIKCGADFVTPEGKIIPNNYLTTDPTPSLSYAYCSDTQYNPRVAKSVEGIHTIYHEATYTEESRDKAHQRAHSTAREAAMIAREAGARQLVLGHFSKQYKSEEGHLEEAKKVFENTILAKEGLVLDLGRN